MQILRDRGGAGRQTRERAEGFWRREDGVIAPLAAILMPIMIGSAAISAEALYRYMEQRNLQYAADTAAFSAAVVSIEQGFSQDHARRVAGFVARESGYDEPVLDGNLALSSSQVQFSVDPETGKEQVRVELRISRGSLFSSILGEDLTMISAASTASNSASDAVGPALGNTGGCLIGLDRHDPGVDIRGGSTNINMPKCAVVSNTTISSTGNSNPNLNSHCVSPVMPNGYRPNSQVCRQGWTQDGPFQDPWAEIIDFDNFDESLCVGGRWGALPMGNLQSGIHCVDESIRITGNTTVSGNNVTIFMKPGTELFMAGNSNMNITAPGANGAFPGLLFYGPEAVVDFRGSNLNWYAGCEGMVALNWNLQGNVNFGSDCDRANYNLSLAGSTQEKIMVTR